MQKNTYKPQGYYVLSNLGGITCQLDETCEGVRYQWYNNKPSRWCKLYRTANGREYFKINGRRYHLDQFMSF